jgi:hypothetical protein
VEGGRGAAVVEQGGELGEGDDKVVQDVRHGVVGRHQRALGEPVQHAAQHFRFVRLYTGRSYFKRMFHERGFFARGLYNFII